jgi:hypothetical protein
MRTVLALLVVAVTGGCHAPTYVSGHLQCAANGACPNGFYCADDLHCWLNGSSPPGGQDLASTPPSDFAGLILDLADGNPSKCTNANVLFCDGFETTLTMNGWGQSLHNGTLAIDNTRAFRGKSSLRSSIQASAANTSPHATLHESSSFPVAGVLYARVYVYFPSPLASQFEQFLNFTDSGSTGISVDTDTGKVTLDDYAGAVYQPSMTRLPLDRWVCVQFQMSQGSTVGAVQISIDGMPLTDLSPTVPTPTAVGMILGVDFDSNNAAVPAYDAWFDEIIVDKNPISCSD